MALTYGNKAYVIVAVIGLVVTSFALGVWATSPPQRHERLERSAEYRQIDLVRNVAARLLERGGNPSDYNPPCHKSQEDRHSDLCAQWRAADAAHSSANWARRAFIAGTILGVLTLAAAAAAAIFARLAAVHTESGAREAKRSADAAHDANRPWIEISLVPNSGLRIDDQGIEFRVQIHMHNRGNSPATHVMAMAQLAASSDGEPLDVSKAVGKVRRLLDRFNYSAGISIFPGRHAMQNYVVRMSPAELDAERSDKTQRTIVVFSVGVRYSFGERIGLTVTSITFIPDGSFLGIDVSQNGEIVIARLDDNFVGYAT